MHLNFRYLCGRATQTLAWLISHLFTALLANSKDTPQLLLVICGGVRLLVDLFLPLLPRSEPILSFSALRVAESK